MKLWEKGLQRAYGVIEVKSFDEVKRTFKGIASTITPDRMDDIVVPQGAQFKLPLPLLWQHDKNAPVGWVTKATIVDDKHIEVEGELAKLEEPASLKDELDRAWAKLKSGLVRGLSIGFIPKEWSEIKNSWGLKFTKWDWIELSAVTIPANSEASIQVIRSCDVGAPRSSLRPESGCPNNTQTLPAAAGSTTSRGKTMNLQESIKKLEAERAAKDARMKELLEIAAKDDNRPFTQEEEEEFDGLEKEVAAIDKHLVRQRKMEKSVAETATPVRTVDKSDDPEADAANARQGRVTWGKSVLPKGTAFTRYCMALAASKGVRADALDYASRWKDSTPQVFNAIRDHASDMVQKSAMAAGSTTDSDWADPLVNYQIMASEFIDLLRPATILGKMSRVRRVPFNIQVAGKTQGSTVGWTGQGAPKPVSELKFNEVTLGFAKAAGIVVITEELAKFSSPSAEALVRQDLIDTMAQFLDEQFIDPAVAAVANVSPASVLNGVAGQKVTSTGSTVALVTADVKSIFDLFANADLSPSNGVWVMRPAEAIALSLLRTSQDVFAFPTINAEGGTWFGYPVIVSNSVPYTASGGAIVAFIKQDEIFLADEGGVRIDVSNQAAIQMDSAPSAGAQSLVSLWQNNLIGIRAERFINWQRRRDVGVAYIDATHY